MKMSLRSADVQVGSSASMGASSGVEAQDTRMGINNFHVAHSLIKSILLPTDVEAFNAEGGAFRMHDAYDSIL